MGTRGKVQIWTVLLVMVLTVSLIPVLPESRSYAEIQPASATLAAEPGFLLPVTQKTEVPDGYAGIYTKEGLDQVRENPGGKYILMNDIGFTESDFDVNGLYYFGSQRWEPLGNDEDPFTGILDGNGYSIVHLSSSRNMTVDGLFGTVSGGGIYNLRVDQVDISGRDADTYSGGIAGKLENGARISNCIVSGKVTGEKNTAGGIAGYVGGQSVISYAYNSSTLFGTGTAGGIAGVIDAGGTVTNCFSLGKVAGFDTESVTGGIAGVQEAGGLIESCYNTGQVIAGEPNNYTSNSAIAGGISGTAGGTIQNCFNTGSIQAFGGGTAYQGGIAGRSYPSAIFENSYNCGYLDRHFSVDFSGGIAGLRVESAVINCYWLKMVGATGLGAAITLDEMKSKGTYVGFDFSEIWGIDATGTYPLPYIKSLGLPVFPDNTTDFVSGDGSLFHPFHINSLDQLKKISAYPYYSFVLDVDLVLTDTVGTYVKIAPLCGPKGFTGILDGQGHRISGLMFDSSLGTDVGLIGIIAGGGEVKNIRFDNCRALGEISSDYAGIVAGRLSSQAVVSNCTIDGIVKGYYAGGIAGSMHTGSRISGCTVNGTVNGEMAAGIVGWCASSDCIIESCINNAQIAAPRTAGGIAGNCIGKVTDCVNNGPVAATSSYSINIGGIVAYGTSFSITNCRNHGSVTASPGELDLSAMVISIGGIAGKSGGGTISQCANTGQIKGGISPEETLETTTPHHSYAGGIIGYNLSKISESYNNGLVYAYSVGSRKAYAGGLAGYQTLPGNTQDSYNTATIHANGENAYAGGVCGYLNTDSLISRCHNLGTQNCTAYYDAYLGGVAGFVSGSGLTDCYTIDCNESDAYGLAISQSAFTVQEVFQYDFAATWMMDPQAKFPVLRNNKPVVFPISYQLNGGALPWDGIYGYMPGSPLKLLAPDRNGYTFLGWYEDSGFSGSPISATPDHLGKSMTLHAKWLPNTYSIKFNGNGSSAGTMASLAMTYDASKALTANAYKKVGYAFLGWAKTASGDIVYKDKATVKNLTSANQGTVALYAKWGAPIQSATSKSYNSIKVTWAYAGNATAYKIYQSYNGGTYRLVHTAGASSRSWVSTGLKTGVLYFYRVYPVAGGKTYTHSTYKYTKPIPATPALTLTKVSATSIKVAWTGVSGATKYQVYRATSSTGTYSLVYTASSTSRSWVNTGRTPGKTYYYKVRAYHLEGTTKVYGAFSTVKYLKI